MKSNMKAHLLTIAVMISGFLLILLWHTEYGDLLVGLGLGYALVYGFIRAEICDEE